MLSSRHSLMEPRHKQGPEGESCSDAELMQKLAKADPQPLQILYLRYGALVRGVVVRLGRVTPSEAEDVCQEVFLTLFDLAPRYVESGKLRSFLCGIALRKARARRRRTFFRDAILRRFRGANPGAAAMFESSIETDVSMRAEVRRALGALPEDQRKVLLLHVLENLSGNEIADALGISPNTVWTRLHRARAVMRQVLGDRTRGD